MITKSEAQPAGIAGLDVVESDDAKTATAAAKAVVAKPASEADLWIELQAQIDDFAVAKSISDFLEASPDDLKRHTALYVRAKVTLKRGQIAYAEAQKAVETARKSSSGVLAGLDRTLKRLDAAVTDVMLSPMPFGTAILVAMVAGMFWLR